MIVRLHFRINLLLLLLLLLLLSKIDLKPNYFVPS